jgi:amino acid transporter
MNWKEVFKITWIPVLFASLCCLAPVVLVLFGLSTVAFAASLADSLYGDYKWVFRGLGFLLLTGSLFYYFWNRGICTIDQAVKQRRKIVNTILVVLIVAIIAYILWLYVIVEVIGIVLGIWENPFA